MFSIFAELRTAAVVEALGDVICQSGCDWVASGLAARNARVGSYADARYQLRVVLVGHSRFAKIVLA